MTRKEEKQRWVVLSIIGLVVGFCIVKNVMWPWFNENREVATPWIVRGLLLGIIVVSSFFPVRSMIRKERFLRLYGKSIDAKDQTTKESKKVLEGISNELSKLEAEVQRLSREARSC